MTDPTSPLHQMMATLPQVGRIEGIWLRPARKAPPVLVDSVTVDLVHGLAGDHYRGQTVRSKRQVTVIQHEHLAVIAALSDTPDLSPATLRRNLVVSGIPVGGLKDRRFAIGEHVVLEWTDECDPCSRMEDALGAGGFNSMRGMGGICCRVIAAGEISVGDRVVVVSVADETDPA